MTAAREAKADYPDGDYMRRIVSLVSTKQFDDAAQAARALTQSHPRHPFAWSALAMSLHGLQRHAQAVEAMRMAAQLSGDADSYNNLGLLLQESGRSEEAEAALRMSLRIQPDNALPAYNLGRCLLLQGRRQDAEQQLRAVLKFHPGLAEAHNTLGVVLKEGGHLSEALACAFRAVELRPDYGDARVSLGAILCAAGYLDQAEAQFEEALRFSPGDMNAFDNLLFVHNYSGSAPVQNSVAIARRFGEVATSRVRAPFLHAIASEVPQPLRIGFVSGDLRDHPVGYFIESLFASLDPRRIAIHVYSTTAQEDGRTQRLRQRSRSWKLLTGLSDEEAARTIDDDGIHILVDLAGHTSQNRLGVFAWKPAPVQISWLGYFATTGVAEVDYLLADVVSIPQEHRNHFTEEIWYLPHTRLCFTPPVDAPPIVLPPALRNGFVTFGCFQNLAKLTDAVVSAWQQILSACPDARLRLQNKQMDDPQTRARTLQRLTGSGVSPSRLQFHGSMPYGDYLSAYGEVDIVLDTFPFNGGTTTCEALWMGVPTVTLIGDRMIARQGASLLAAAGLEDWIAQTPADYRAKALARAGDFEALRTLRAQLREQVRVSPLFNALDFARDFEEALAGMWNDAAKSRSPGHEAGNPVSGRTLNATF